MRLIESLLQKDRRSMASYRPKPIYRTPEPPLGFISRSDPNFYFLARKF